MSLYVVLAGDHVRLQESVFAPAGTAPRGAIPATALRDADPTAVPPEIRTLSGDTVFVSAVQRGELERFCAANGVPLRVRPDVWGDLLEYFLDTGFTPGARAATQARLSLVGLGEGEVAGIRHEVAPLMHAYNGLHQDWYHLGLADLLDAAAADRTPGHLRIPPAERAAFCAWAMGIADLGHAQRG
ncbi:hypothetical protein [Kitasatospora sp. NPDC057936]|uniref:hypothetical protein n=1 Tax=Kitasatospora sp. NPDC057936 TaxID=3346283 RepID=UPI0036DAD2FD